MLISTNSGLHSAKFKEHVRFDLIEESLDFFADHGFEAVDVNFCATIYNETTKHPHEPVLDGDEETVKHNLDRIVQKCKDRNLVISGSHLPFFKYHLRDNPDYDRIQEMVYRSIDAAEYIGVPWTVVHFVDSVESTVNYTRDLAQYVRDKNYKIGLAIENTPKNTLENLITAVDILRNEGYRIGICFDTGHCNLAGMRCSDALRMIGDRLQILHVHDNDGNKDSHRMPFAGNIDWRDCMTALKEIGYTGPFNYEISGAPIPNEARPQFADYCVALARYLLSIYNEA